MTYNIAMPAPRLLVLGSPKFERDGQPVELTAAKAIALLGYLATTPDPQPRERLLGLLWAESSEDAARKNLRNTLWTIRKALGENVLSADDDHLAIDAATWVDVREFETVAGPGRERRIGAGPPREAVTQDQTLSMLSLFRGPLLDGIVLSDAPEFEIWLTGERERLAQLYSRGLESLVDALRRAGDWPAVVDVAQRALAHDNLQEPMYRSLMEAHARLGERAEALRQYDTLEYMLQHELGVKPLPQTTALRQAIVDGAIQPATPAPANLISSAASKQPTGYLDQLDLPYIGRRPERLALDEESRRAGAGEARIVLLMGEVGIGKSRLWREWSANLSPDVTVLQTRCLDSTQALPFAPLIELFADPALARRVFTPLSPVSPVWLAEIARLFPDLRVIFPDLPPPVPLPPEEERRRLFEAFTQCLLVLGTGPLVLFFDDVHWADRATMDWLDYLVHRLRKSPLLLVAAYRPEDAPTWLIHLVAHWGREGLTRKISLERLSSAESAALIASLGGDPETTERIQAHSGGNPYFLIEMYRAADQDIPPVLTELIRARVDRLPDTARQVLQAASVLGTAFDFSTMRRTSGRSEEETLEALDALLNALVLVERDGHYEFAHPLVAEVVQGGLSGARRAFVHRRAAQALEASDPGRVPQIAGQLAAHYALAGDSKRAAHFAEMAAERALALAAAQEAVNFYRQALALEPTPGRQMGLGRVLLQQVELEEARSAFTTALDGFLEQGDRRAAARAALLNSETFFPSGRFEEGKAWIARAMALSESQGDAESHALAHLALGSGLPQDRQAAIEAENHLVRAADEAVAGNLPDIAARSYFMLGNLLAERGDLTAAVKAYEQSVRSARAAGDEFQQVLGYNNLAYHSLLLGDLAAAHRYVDEGMALAEQRALRLPLQHLLSTRGEIALVEKNWDEAEDWIQRALVEAEKNSNAREVANDRANLGLVARGRGDLDGALMQLENARHAASGLADVHLQIKIDLALVELYLQRGERAAAKESLTRARARLAGGERRRLSEWAERLGRQIRGAS